MADDRDDDQQRERDSKRLSEVFDRAMRRFDATVQPQVEMRAQALQARRFVSIPGAMWDGAWGDQFENSIKVEVPKVLRGLRKIQTDYRENRIVPDYRPAGGDSSNETADTLDGVHRADSYFFKAQQARDNAFNEATAGGFGAYRLATDWADPYDPDSDQQRINPGLLIADADQSVFFDGNSKLYDKSDAGFGFVLTAMTPDAYRAEWDGEYATFDNGLLQTWFDWFRPDMIRVAEYYEVEDKTEKLWIFTLAISGEERRHFDADIEESDARELLAQGWKRRSREVKRRRVRKYVLSGTKVLKDCGYIAGEHIPIVPVYGNREYIDNMERFTGYVQPKMDSQRLYNSKVSKLAETDALAPREVPIVTPQQIAGHENTWAQQNIERHPYALLNPLINEVTGEIIQTGPIGKIEPPQLQPVTAALLQIANTDLTEDDQDGADEVKANTSVEAMDLAAQRVDAKSGIYMDNMRQSVQREGEIYLSMAKDVYFEPGRVLPTMSEEGDDGTAEIAAAFTDKTGKHRTINDFARGRYNVIASVTEATATRRDKTVRASLNLANIAQQAQDVEMAQAALITAAMNMDGEGMGDMQKWARKRALTIGLVEPTEEEAQQLAEQQQAQGQPDPLVQAQVAALAGQAEKDAAAAEKSRSGAALDQAKVAEAQASAILKAAQAEQLGGPVEAPPVPDGLEQAERMAGIENTLAQADATRETARTQRIMRGRDLTEADREAA